LNEAGRVEKVKLKLPAEVRLKPEPGRSLNDMLLAGDLDAVPVGPPSERPRQRHPAPLFGLRVGRGKAYFRQTGNLSHQCT